MNELQLSGTVERHLFQNSENGYAVSVISVSDRQTIVVKGHMAHVQPGEQVLVTGAWVQHPKFGKQFEAATCVTQVPTSLVGLKKYLGSGLIKGIGPSYAQRLIDAFGSQVLEVIDKHPEKLTLVEGIGQKRAQEITTAWQSQKDIASIMVFLQEKGVSPAYAVKIYKKYGQASIAMVQENPYRLAEDIWGIGFKLADQIAQAIGIASDSLKRVMAAYLHQLSVEASSGHLYSFIEPLKQKTAQLLEFDLQEQAQKLKNALHQLHDEGKIKLISSGDEHYIGLALHYFTEKNVADRIKLLLSQSPTVSYDTNVIYNKLRAPDANKKIHLNEDQQHGIVTALSHQISIITGGPGTGKTTLIKELLDIIDEHRAVYRLAAPTGRAAKRITEGTQRNAATIHRLLEFDFLTHRFLKNEQNALKVDFLIIDESSMLDVFLMHSVLKAIPFGARVVFIGDIDQLPSVGAGNVLHDMIVSGVVPTVRLKTIFRQAQDSMIVVNAHRVNSGQFPLGYQEGARRDFIFIKEENPEQAMTHIRELLLKRLGLHGMRAEDATILVPMNKTIVGAQTMNAQLQELLNHNQERVEHHGTTFKMGDRVMQIRNNYDKIVFNGDVGIIEEITSEKKLRVNYSDRIVEYEFNELDELTLAYAMTIHKSQGSEYPAVIIPIFMQHFTLLQRNLVYTAITRAKRLCVLIGQTKAIAMAINNDKGTVRLTLLKQFLTSDLACR